MSPLTVGIILAVYALIMWLVVFFVWARGYREWKANRAARLWHTEARVVAKREVAASDELSEIAAKARVGDRLVTFRFGARQKEFRVPASTYSAVRIGQEGTLYLRGGRFEGFEPKAEGEDVEGVYRRVVRG